MKKKRMAILICCLIAAMCIPLSLSGCKYTYETRAELLKEAITSGDFVYIKHTLTWKDGTSISGVKILTLSEVGKYKEVITIPKEIDGLAVIGIGIYMPTGQEIYFDSIKTKKIFVPWDVAGYIKDGKWTQNIILDFLRTSNNETPLSIVAMNTVHHIIVKPREGYFGDFIVQRSSSDKRVDYNYNYTEAKNGGSYFIDIFEKNEYIIPPPEPTRDGYIFDGWYKGKECTQIFDFATEVKGEKTLTFYAKWIKAE